MRNDIILSSAELALRVKKAKTSILKDNNSRWHPKLKKKKKKKIEKIGLDISCESSVKSVFTKKK